MTKRVVDRDGKTVLFARTRSEDQARRTNRRACEAMLDTDTVWYVLFVMSGKEFVAQKILRKWGANAYLPLRVRWRKHSNKHRQKSRIAYPAVPRCVFVGMPKGEENWYGLFELNTIQGVLSIGGEPAVLRTPLLRNFIEDNRSRFEVPDEHRYMPSNREYDIGDQVRIIDGPFEGHTVEVTDMLGPNALILIDLLGAQQKMKIPLDRLEIAA